jgi:hypothetical protein
VLTCYEGLKARNVCGSLFLLKRLYLDAIWQDLKSRMEIEKTCVTMRLEHVLIIYASF